MYEASVGSYCADQRDADSRRREEVLNGFFFNAISKRRNVDMRPGIKVVGAVDCDASTVKKVLAVEGIDLKRFNHPTQNLGIGRLALIVDPGCFVCLHTLSDMLNRFSGVAYIVGVIFALCPVYIVPYRGPRFTLLWSATILEA